MNRLIDIVSVPCWRIVACLAIVLSVMCLDTAGGMPTPPEIAVNRTNLSFGAITNGGVTSTATAGQRLLIGNSGGGTLVWTASSDADWLICMPSSGIGSGIVKVYVAPCGLPSGHHTGTVTISDPDAANSPQSVSVDLNVKNPEQDQPPFGTFETPQNGATIRGSVPVTGWVLDDVQVDNVKIYNGASYVGDAVLVEGARPDVERAYPGHPAGYKAGWGYMLLTNFLPGGGNGTYTLSARATDSEGNEVTLGSRTVVCDNAHAVKPFGAIDTPTQGGTASGSSFMNWGWVLTPRPNAIPSSGSTINVYVDGVNIGHPAYNVYRQDIATLFPDYVNSDGAAGYFSLDTTGYADGVHTIQWSATDNGGNSDGIGSRYFTIQNAESYRGKNRDAGWNRTGAAALDAIPVDYTIPVQVRQGYDESAPFATVSPDGSGVIQVSIRETERLEVRLNETGFTGYSYGNGAAGPLPVGSTLDAAGIFSWIPGPGFLGTFDLAFVRDTGAGAETKKAVKVYIGPMQVSPSTGIAANGSSGVLNVGSSDPVSVAVTLNPGDFPGMEVDYWLVAERASGWESYLLNGTWQSGVAALARAGLFAIDSPLEVFTLPSVASDTTFYFAVSTPSLDRIWFSWVRVEVGLP